MHGDVNLRKVRKDLTNQTFGRLKVLKQADDYISPSGVHLTQWLCECSCDSHKQIIALGCNLTKGDTKSCGCLRKENSTKMAQKPNDYEIQEDYVIMYTNKGEMFLVDLEDFWKVKDISWHKNEQGYIVSTINGKQTRIHRFIMNCPQGYDIDHKYGKTTRYDNRKYNLRIATRSQNNTNKGLQINNTTGITGVYKHSFGDKWYANIWQNNKTIYLGLFDTKEEAIFARKQAEEKYYGEFSYDNSQKQSVENIA